MASNLIPPWSPSVVQAVADILGATDTGLTGSEIGQPLAAVRAPDVAPGLTKRIRLGQALLAKQSADGGSNSVVRFITEAIKPIRYRDRPSDWTRPREDLDEVLVYQGFRILDDGRIGTGIRASTLSQAAQHANSMRTELRRRGTHPDVPRYCTEEIRTKNALHAMLEASKSVFDKPRDRSGLSGDGAALVDGALALGKTGTPRLAINGLSTQTERDEQTGLANLIKGLSSMYRNPTAHDPRLKRQVTDDELLESLRLLSMVHRRVDEARVIGP